MPASLRLPRRRRPAARGLFLEPLEDRTVFALELISAALPSVVSNGVSTAPDPPAITSDGQLVGFVSSASNLVAGDTNRLQDVFVRNTTTDTTEMISVTSAGGSANGLSSEVALTPDGRYAVFTSAATNLTLEGLPGVFVRDRMLNTLLFIAPNAYAPSISSDGRYIAFMAPDNTIAGDNNNSDDVFVWDRVTSAITRQSQSAAGVATPTFTVTGNPMISADGNFVAFNSNAGNLVANDTNGFQDIFVKNVKTGAIERVSVTATGIQGDSDSILPAISQDGQFVAFRTTASTFVANDSNNQDLFRKNRQSLALERVSETSAGNASNGTTYSKPVISSDGRYVTFSSDATNLTTDTSFSLDAFMKDMTTDSVTLVSASASNTQGNNNSFNPTATSSARFTAFYSQATNLIGADINGFTDIFWKDRQSGTVKLVSANFDPTNGFSANNNSFAPGAMTNSVSGNGRYVAFTSAATNLIANDTNGTAADIYLRDTTTGVTTLVSTNTNGVQANGDSYWPSLSSDGRYLTFTSEANNLVANDTNNFADIFRKDLTTGAVLRVTVTAIGQQSNSDSDQSMVSDDGRYVVFYSTASNLVANDGNVAGDIFRKDIQTGVIELASQNASNQQALGESDVPSLTADGRYVVFQSNAANLVTGDTNSVTDVFYKDMNTGAVRRVSVTSAAAQVNGASTSPRIASGGRYVAFQSVANNLIAGDTNGSVDVFVKDLTDESLDIASTSAAGVIGNFNSTAPVVSNDGLYVAFLSTATNLVTGDTNGFRDVFRKDLATGAITRLSVSDAGVQADGPSDRPSILRDGSLVTFGSGAENLTSYDGQGFFDVFRAGAQAATGLTLTLAANSVPQNVGTVTATLTRSGSTASALVISLSSSNTAVATVPASVTIAAGQTQATFTITVLGTSSTVISASATGMSTVTQTLTVTAVSGVNDPPSFTLAGNPPTITSTAGAQTVNGFATNISPGPADEAGQLLTFFLQVTSTTGNLQFATAPAINPSTGTLTYTAVNGTSGTALVRVILFDDGGTANGGDNSSDAQAFTITVNPANPAFPVISGLPGSITLRVNEATGPLPFVVSDDTTPAGNLQVTASSSNTSLIPNGNLTLTGAGSAQRTISVTPTANQTGGPVTITVNVTDAQANVTTVTFQVTVIPFLAGDVSPDGVIDAQDVAYMTYYFSIYAPSTTANLPAGPPKRADVNNDGLFDAQDVLQVVYWFSQASGGEGESSAAGSGAATTGATAADAPAADNTTSYDLALLQLFETADGRKKK